MPLNRVAPLHDLPKHPERVLPKFHPEKCISAEYHLKSFYLALNILNVEHEYVVCRIFQYSFETKASSWYLLICHSGLGIENIVSQRIQTNMHKIGKKVLQWN